MKPAHAVRTLLLSMWVAASLAAAPAFAQININISIAPPAPLYEPAPDLGPGYVWAPGYWAWHGDRYIWVRGRSIVQRAGFRWEPDRWEQRGRTFLLFPGRWERDENFRVIKIKKEKKSKHWDKDDDDDDDERGHRKGERRGKGRKHDN